MQLILQTASTTAPIPTLGPGPSRRSPAASRRGRISPRRSILLLVLLVVHQPAPPPWRGAPAAPPPRRRGRCGAPLGLPLAGRSRSSAAALPSRQDDGSTGSGGSSPHRPRKVPVLLVFLVSGATSRQGQGGEGLRLPGWSQRSAFVLVVAILKVWEGWRKQSIA